MHALILHQLGGEPWSFSVPGVDQPQVFRDVGDAVNAAHDTYPVDVAIRIGPTGPSATARSAAAAMFAPCSNITIAARQIAELAERCKTSWHSNRDPIYCAIAAYRGSWDRPDDAFAVPVRTSVANNDAMSMPVRFVLLGALLSKTRPRHRLPRRMIASAPD
jgi:hypothetical protein